MRLSHDNSERLIAIPGWRAERLGQGSFGSKTAQRLMSALSPFYPQLRTLVGAAGTAAQCHDHLLGRDVDAIRIKAGIERAVVDVLRTLGFLDPAPKGRPPLRIVKEEAKD
jgi:hypothetical protein